MEKNHLEFTLTIYKLYKLITSSFTLSTFRCNHVNTCNKLFKKSCKSRIQSWELQTRNMVYFIKWKNLKIEMFETLLKGGVSGEF